MSPNCFNNIGAQLTAELIDHAGDSGPTGVKRLCCNEFVNLASGKHLTWSASQQKQNIELHWGQLNGHTKQPYQVLLRVNF